MIESITVLFEYMTFIPGILCGIDVQGFDQTLTFFGLTNDIFWEPICSGIFFLAKTQINRVVYAVLT